MTSTARRLTAHAGLDVIVLKLAGAGWGILGGREWHGLQKVLVAFAACDDISNATGAGFATVGQLAERASLSETWTRSRLVLLEDLGVIEWTRGGIRRDGRPAPSWFRVVKARIVDLIMAARPVRDEAERARWAETRARVAHLYYLRGLYLRGAREAKKRRSRRSVHPQVSDYPPPLRGMQTTRVGSPRPWEVLETCRHDSLVGRCGSCRAEEMSGPRSAGAQR